MVSGPSEKTRELRDRFLAALMGPAGGGSASGVTLLGVKDPVALLDLPEEGTGLVLLERGDEPHDELRQRLERLLKGHTGGVLFLVLVGAQSDGREDRSALTAADRAAPDPNRLGIYQLYEGGRITHVVGRRLRRIVRAARATATVAPLAPGEIPAAIERGHREREEAATFAMALARRPPRVTWAIIAACVALFLLARRWSANAAVADAYAGTGVGAWPATLLLMGANSAPLVAAGQVWRLLSHAFLHGSLAHLLVNMLALQSFGGFLESLLGVRRYLVLFVACALAGGVASALLAGTQLSVGASGALWGLMAAGFGLLWRRGQTLIPARVALRLRRHLLVVLLLNGVLSFAPGIDLFAHFGGGLLGFALAVSKRLDGAGAAARDGRPDSRPLRVAGLAAALAIVTALAAALASGRAWEQ